MLRLRQLSQLTPGIDGACKEIENAVELGTDHLVDHTYVRIHNSSVLRSMGKVMVVLGVVGVVWRYGRGWIEGLRG